MANDRWAKLSLRVASTALTAGEIARAVSVEPTVSANAGDRISARSPGAGLHDRALCVFDSPLSSEVPLDAHIDWLVQFLREQGAGIEPIADKCEIDVRIGFSSGSGQGGFAIAADSLALLCRFRADLLVDLYPPEDGSGAGDQ